MLKNKVLYCSCFRYVLGVHFHQTMSIFVSNVSSGIHDFTVEQSVLHMAVRICSFQFCHWAIAPESKSKGVGSRTPQNGPVSEMGNIAIVCL